MSITIELTPEEETLLRDAAHKNGMDASAYIKAMLFHTARNAPPPAIERTREERMAYLAEVGEAASLAAVRNSTGKEFLSSTAKTGKSSRNLLTR